MTCVTLFSSFVFFFSSRRRHTRCALVTGVQTCARPFFVHGASPSPFCSARRRVSLTVAEEPAELRTRLLLRDARPGALQRLGPVLGGDHLLGLELLLGGQRNELVGRLLCLKTDRKSTRLNSSH